MLNFRTLVAASALVLLAACGGGGKAGTSPFSTNAQGAITVSKLSLQLSSATLSNSSSTPVTATVTTADSTGKALTGVAVSYSLTSGIYSASSTTTDSKGQTTADINIGDDKSNRTIAVTATAGGQSVTKFISVSGSKIDVTATPTLVDPGAAGKLDFVVKDANGNPQANVNITVEGSGLETKSDVTASDGSYAYTYTAPNSPGSSLIFTAKAAGVTRQQDVAIKAPSQVVPTANMSLVAAPSLQVTPNVVAVNDAGSKTNKVQLVANFETSSGLPVSNVRVMFRLKGAVGAAVGGEFSNGGSVTAGSNVVLSGIDGKAQAFYVPGTVSSGNGKVIIEACYGGTNADAQACTTSLTQNITVVDEPVSVTIGTDNLIQDDSANLRYAQRYVVQVVNSAGQPKSGVQISAQISTVEFIKGQYKYSVDRWVIPLNGTAKKVCSKEDTDSDDNKDTGEDLDHDGQLEPVRADVTLGPLVSGVSTTNEDGIVLLKMSYPKDKATWMTVSINVTALVGGSEGRATRVQLLNAPIEDIKKEGAPAFVISPYGVEYLDVDVPARVEPDLFARPATTALPACENKD